MNESTCNQRRSIPTPSLSPGFLIYQIAAITPALLIGLGLGKKTTAKEGVITSVICVCVCVYKRIWGSQGWY